VLATSRVAVGRALIGGEEGVMPMMTMVVVMEAGGRTKGGTNARCVTKASTIDCR
jgi:hypothetical protein